MSQTKKISIVLAAVVAIVLLAAWGWRQKAQPAAVYYANKGTVFGTYYNIQYQAEADLHDSILAAFDAFDRSLSMFNRASVISRINHNQDTLTDAFFEQMWAEAARVHALSGGAFDITVAPLVNLWGFGFKHREQVTAAKIDSLLPLVGFEKVALRDHRVWKADERIMLDASAVAKGQACDVVAALLARNGAENYLVDIGGEVVAKGLSKHGEPWRIGITKPVDDPTGESKALQDIIQTTNICMATSGNYRNFYYEGGERRSHTIDPRTGYPVQHSLLSATVVASSCMRADALATACMVLGTNEAKKMLEQAGDAAGYFIIAQGDSTVVVTTTDWSFHR